ncbi:MAG: hypothetical protein UV64_C0006G0025 [Parcubacteria group bacterium GW2011_GWC1_43_11b]|uniref:Uncharacterized protein n=2 Tax=Candidatus Vogeliibacteriota TaxID=1817922 RepID=A0A1G2QCY4_9BACT|nr:MAG: hypothetical protein UV50_C0004G0037 [Parcubacteria group bacterium GW2011_GWB1_42_9]KKS89445.1 MAG: hypothetical protein UV64_C0006G0025 [Parcubacteria group bacterium GW2011_GWC1_43_11b]KKT10032.1 MAG: hypothetical protein UV88_C0003G0034 [Parcubacteria group bacterium GW2011_GWA1_43_21]OHA58004.1 MAG: hypothetical protein A2607_00910 [Candidatus Vogelbacteria bacterium RIFOXYD1_FULL_42_15]OHA58347.1 MAG: hypothetical protein A2370_01350 [Candidatus Vogelbacteria bacterium RIFOXYB1_FU
MFKKISTFFDRMEDRTRGYLSRYPNLYAIIAGTGLILFWRGIWEGSIGLMSNFMSTVIGAIILLSTGVLVSYFIGDKILISGIKGEKKIIEKTREEIEDDDVQLKNIDKKIDDLRSLIEKLSK